MRETGPPTPSRAPLNRKGSLSVRQTVVVNDLMQGGYRYGLGRRHPDDERQIKRWRAIRRHVVQVRNHCPPRALECRRRQRQALLHWAYDSRQI
jgi:hypothetical protein